MGKFNLANALLHYRMRECLTQKEMGEKLNMSRSAYDRLEKDLRKPGYDEVLNYISILNLRVDEEEIGLRVRDPLSGTINYLRKGLLYNTLSLSDALSCLKELAYRINCESLSRWVHYECTTYPEYPGFADYRICPLVYSVNFEKGKERFTDFPVAYELLFPDDAAGRWFYHCERVAGFYEEFLLEDGEISYTAKEMLNSVQGFLRNIFGPEVRIIAVTQKIPGRTCRKIILAVQEIMLNFILSLERRFGSSPSIEVLCLNSKEIEILFSEALARTGKADHLELPVKFKPIDPENNANLLMDFLYDYDVSDTHFDAIIDLLEEEEKKGKIPETLGTPLTNMILKMAEIYPKFGPEGIKLRKAFMGYLGWDKGDD